MEHDGAASFGNTAASLYSESEALSSRRPEAAPTLEHKLSNATCSASRNDPARREASINSVIRVDSGASACWAMRPSATSWKKPRVRCRSEAHSGSAWLRMADIGETSVADHAGNHEDAAATMATTAVETRNGSTPGFWIRPAPPLPTAISNCCTKYHVTAALTAPPITMP